MVLKSYDGSFTEICVIISVTLPCLEAASVDPVFLPLPLLDLAWLEQPASWILLAPLHPTNKKAPDINISQNDSGTL